MNIRIVSLAVAVGLAVAAGCAATQEGKARDIKYSGFLSTYAGLTATHDSNDAAYEYVEPGIDLASYTGVLIDQPVAHMSEKALREIGPEDTSYLLGAFDRSLRDAIGAKFNVVEAPGPGVMRIRTCLTDAESAIGILTPFSRVVPAGVIISNAKKLATGTAVNVGDANAEMEILDSVSGVRLGAGVDRRVGTGVARNMLSSWADVDSAFDYWGELTAKRLAKFGMRTVK